MKYYDFTRLISKYSSVFVLKKPSKGVYVGGQYQSTGSEEKQLTGAITDLSATKIYRSGGYLTAKDKQLYTLQPIEGALDGCKVIFEGVEYSIESDSQEVNERFTGVSSYVLKQVKGL